MESCEFANWYKLFKNLTPKTIVLEAPEEFRNYLLADGIQIPDFDTDASDSEDAEPEQDSEAEDETTHLPPRSFHELIEASIAKLDGAVCPKLNWSSPKDATWMSPTTNMKCVNANDIYMLLKASDHCTHDLKHNPRTLTLVLREWYDINPSMEFRCFVKTGKVIAITQRDLNYYDFLLPLKAKIINLAVETAGKISEKFTESNYAVDIYIPKSHNTAWIVDINPWTESTDTLLFSWEELELWDVNSRPLEVRFVQKDEATRTFSSKPYSTNSVPHDLVDMPRGEFAELIEQLKESRLQQMKSDQ